MSIFDELDKSLDLNELCDSVNNYNTEAKMDFPEIPSGKYEVAVENMELGVSRSGKPMLKVQMGIVDGDYVNQKMFINQVVDPNSDYFNMNMHTANELLRGFLVEVKDAPVVKFEGFAKYANLVTEVFDLIKDDYEYQVHKEVKKSKKGAEFTVYTVLKTYVLE